MLRKVKICEKCAKCGSKLHPSALILFLPKGEDPREMHYICFVVDRIGIEPKEIYEMNEVPEDCILKLEYTVLEQNK